MRGWFGQSREKAAAGSLYEAALSASREPLLYAIFGVPDTIEGRFEMLALHLSVLLDRLGGSTTAARQLSVPLTEQFVVDMDDAMRAHGVGDLSVPRKVKKAAAALYDRHRAYGAAMRSETPRETWSHALGEQLADLSGRERIDLSALTRYATTLGPHLDAQSDGDLAVGRATFPAAQGS